MRRTAITTPGLRPVIRAVSRAIIWALGWRSEGGLQVRKCVAIAAPHTSNWDFLFLVAISYAMGVDPRWMGKKELFRFPLGGIMRWLGGVPVDRAKGGFAATEAIRALRESDDFVLVIPPEGTRGKGKDWKHGFYTIAREAGVPFVFGYLDYARRAGGYGPVFEPTGDYGADIREIRAFYEKVTPLVPERYTLPIIRDTVHRETRGQS